MSLVAQRAPTIATCRFAAGFAPDSLHSFPRGGTYQHLPPAASRRAPPSSRCRTTSALWHHLQIKPFGDSEDFFVFGPIVWAALTINFNVQPSKLAPTTFNQQQQQTLLLRRHFYIGVLNRKNYVGERRGLKLVKSRILNLNTNTSLT